MDLSRLKSNLLNTGLQVKDNPLFQVIDQLIRTIEGLNKDVTGIIATGSSAIVNQNLMNGLTIPLATGEHLKGNEEYGDNPYPALGLIPQNPSVLPKNEMSLGLPPIESIDERYYDSPYLSLNSGIVQNIVNNTNNNNIINNVLLGTEYIDKEYADVPYPSLGTSLPLPIPTAGNPTITDDITTNATMYPVWVTANSGALPLFVTSTKFQLNPFSGTLLLTNNSNVETSNIVAENLNTGTAAASRIRARNDNLNTIDLIMYGSGVTPSGTRLVSGGVLSCTGPGGITIVASDTVATMRFFVSNTAGTPLERMSILANGNVGIGITGPAARLEVVAASGAIGQIDFGITGEGRSELYRTDANGLYIYSAITAAANKNFHFFSGGSATDERITILGASGYVGIGTTNPSNKLVVSDAGAAGIELTPSTGVILGYNRSTLAYVPLVLNGSIVSLGASGAVILQVNASNHIGIVATSRINFDGIAATGDTYILETSANVLDLFVGANKTLSLSATAANVTGSLSATIVSGHPQLFLERTTTGTGKFSIGTNTNTLEIKDEVAAAVRILISSTGAVSAPGGFTSSGGGVGYSTGAGGTVTQITSRTTTVVLNKLCGNITMFSAAHAAQTFFTFTLTNSFIAATDFLAIEHISATNGAAWNFATVCAAGSATITVRNVSTASITEATPLRFIIIKGATS